MSAQKGICGNFLAGCSLALASPPALQDIEPGQPAKCTECGEELRLIGKKPSRGRNGLRRREAFLAVAALAVVAVVGAVAMLLPDSGSAREDATGGPSPEGVLIPRRSTTDRPVAGGDTAIAAPLTKPEQIVKPPRAQPPIAAAGAQAPAARPRDRRQAPAPRTQAGGTTPPKPATETPPLSPTSPPAPTPVATPAPTPPQPQAQTQPGTPVLPAGTTLSFAFGGDLCADKLRSGQEIVGRTDAEAVGTGGASVARGANLTFEVLGADVEARAIALRPLFLMSGGHRFAVTGTLALPELQDRSGASTAENALKIAAGTLGGAVLGGVIGKNRRAIAAGAAAGLAAGTAVAIMTAGKDACVPRRTPLRLTLTEPVTLR